MLLVTDGEHTMHDLARARETAATNGAMSLRDVATVCSFGRRLSIASGAPAMNVIHLSPVARKYGARSVTLGAGQISVEPRPQTACWSHFYAPVLNENDT
jgi:hypothetical protein